MSNLTQTNKQIQSLDIQGDIVPQIWYNHIKYKTEKGKTKTDLLAIAILANTVYWYRPTEIRDESTNKVIGYKKKFESDMLQRSYGQLGNFYGKTKREVKSSIALLVDLNLIKIEFRSLYVRGVLHNNVMFIDLIVDEIKKISMIDDMIYTPPTKKRNSLLQKKDRDYTENLSEPPAEIGNTNTKIISKTTTETSQKEPEKLTSSKFIEYKNRLRSIDEKFNLSYLESSKANQYYEQAQKKYEELNSNKSFSEFFESILAKLEKLTSQKLDRFAFKQGFTIESLVKFDLQGCAKVEAWFNDCYPQVAKQVIQQKPPVKEKPSFSANDRDSLKEFLA